MSAPTNILNVEYNPSGTPPSGATQAQSIALATNNPDYTIGGWVGGVNDTDGYVIVCDTTTLGLAGSGTGGGTGTAPTDTPTFWKSAGLTDQDLIDLVNSLPGFSGSNYTNVFDARNGIASSPYIIINDYSSGVGSHYLYNVYYFADINGSITFPDHVKNSGSLDPNFVGQTDGSTYYVALYISPYDSIGIDNYADLSQLAGNAGKLTLTQNSNSVTYVFTDEAFSASLNYGGGGSGVQQIWHDGFMGGSNPENSLTVLSRSSGDFNTVDPIVISHSIISPNLSFTIDSSMLNGLASVGNSNYGSANGTQGFTVNLPTNILPYGVYGTLNNTTAINNAFTAAGATEGYNGYIVLAQWGAGSTFRSSLAKVAFNSTNNQFYVTSVDGTDNTFTQLGNNAGENLPGTFNFPATFTFITPLINKIDWC
jgi:hypothetical protein